MFHKIRQRKHSLPESFIDWLSAQKMEFVSHIASLVLPPGFWGHKNNLVNTNLEHPIYLTFDDGPSPETTPWLLELLEKENIKASFFLIGHQVEKNPYLVEQIHKSGHSLGNHSYSHKFLPSLPSSLQEKEIQLTNERISEITKESPKLFRPPYGIMDWRTNYFLKERQMNAIYWTQAPEDWALPGSKRVIRRLLYKLSPGNLIVLHEGKSLKEQTIQATKELIYRCKIQNYVLEKLKGHHNCSTLSPL